MHGSQVSTFASKRVATDAPSDLPAAGRKREIWQEEVLVPILHRHAGKRLLVADDNPADRVRLGELLAAARFDLDFAIDGAETVTRASDRQPDLILMHTRMPVMDGLTATRVLRGLPFGRRVPIIAMSAGALDDESIACFSAGIDDIVAKPFVADALHRCLLRWLDRSAAAMAFRGGLAMAEKKPAPGVPERALSW